jgi:hypothetical protein
LATLFVDVSILLNHIELQYDKKHDTKQKTKKQLPFAFKIIEERQREDIFSIQSCPPTSILFLLPYCKKITLCQTVATADDLPTKQTVFFFFAQTNLSNTFLKV